MKNILILEDEEWDRKVVRTIVEGLPQKCQIFECVSCKDGYSVAMEQTIHLFLIDVLLENDRDFSGFKFVQNIRQVEKYREIPIVFISSVRGYELLAFKKMHCYDYIVKPFHENEVAEVLRNALELKAVDRMEERIDFESRGIYYPVEPDSIRYIESNRRTIYIHTVSDVLELNGKSLKECYEKLNRYNFIQVHKSFIVSRKYIVKVDYSQRMIYLRGVNGLETIDIGMKYKDLLREWLDVH